jgi:histone H3/H4
VANLTKASRELFRRTPDEVFATLADITRHCVDRKERGTDKWLPPRGVRAVPVMEELIVASGDGEPLRMTDWSFTQLCGLAKVHKETVNRLKPETAAKVFAECLPQSNKPVQLFHDGERLRSVHGTSYTRLYDADVLAMVAEFAVDFQPPPAGIDGKTGLYAGEQDLFGFFIDPTGWAEVNGEAFAPGFFVWNSEVGKRSVGVQTFWFQAVCRNHIVWDAIDVVEVTRKHTGNVGEALGDIRRAVEQLVAKRDARKDGFVAAMRRAMETKLGDDAEEAMKVLSEKGIGKVLAKQAVELARAQGRFTVFTVVDALTRLAGEFKNAGDRLQADQQAASLLNLVAAPRRTHTQGDSDGEREGASASPATAAA